MNTTLEPETPITMKGLPQEIIRILHHQNMTQQDLADYLQQDKSWLSRALNKNPEKLRPLLPKISTFLKTSSAALLSRANAPVPQTSTSVTAYLFGTKDPDGVLNLSPGCAVRRVTTSDGQYDSAVLLLGPVTKKPRENDVTWVLLRNGRQYVRNWLHDEQDERTVVLIDRTGHDGRPVAVRLDGIEEARLLVGVVELSK